MAQLSGIGFQPGNSFLHGLDARTKLVCFFLLVITVLQLRFMGFVVFSAGMTGLLISVRCRPKTIYTELRYFFPLLILVVLARAISTPGEESDNKMD